MRRGLRCVLLSRARTPSPGAIFMPWEQGASVCPGRLLCLPVGRKKDDRQLEMAAQSMSTSPRNGRRPAETLRQRRDGPDRQRRYPGLRRGGPYLLSALASWCRSPLSDYGFQPLALTSDSSFKEIDQTVASGGVPILQRASRRRSGDAPKRTRLTPSRSHHSVRLTRLARPASTVATNSSLTRVKKPLDRKP